jgi:DNA repair exonuclease SbcCD ATPase subunit
LDRIEADRNAYQALEADYQKQVQQVTEDLQDLQEVQRVLAALSQKINEFTEDSVSKLATVALRDIFFNERLSLEVKSSVTRGHTSVDFLLHDSKRNVSGDILDSFGGGPATLVGLILRVISIVRQPHLSRFLVLDEPLTQVSHAYLEKSARLLRRICEPVSEGGLGFTILVITHDETIKQAAHTSYYASAGDDFSLVLERKSTESEYYERYESQVDSSCESSGTESG